jgi:ATP-binding cassette subfamily F protein uup
VLVLDEPTNDLDIDTLELLEARLQDYAGTLFLVSHDRTFLDNVVTQTIAFEGDGLLREYAGGFSDWAGYHARRNAQLAEEAQRNVRDAPPPASSRPARTNALRLNFNEQRELAALPGKIESLEAAATGLRDRFADGAVYREGAGAVKTLQDQLALREAELAAAYARWEALETRHSASTASGER